MQELAIFFLHIFLVGASGAGAGPPDRDKIRDLINFSDFLDIFTNCLVHIIDFQSINLHSDRIPIALSKLSKLPRSQHDNDQRRQSDKGGEWCPAGNCRSAPEPHPENMWTLAKTSFRFACVAQFYIEPFQSRSSDKIVIPAPFNVLFNQMASSRRYSQMPKVYTAYQDRYHIFVQQPRYGYEKWWKNVIQNVIRSTREIPQAIVLKAADQSGLFIPNAINDELLIINRFKLLKLQFKPTRFQISSILKNENQRKSLEFSIGQVNDLVLHPDSPWSLHYLLPKSEENFMSNSNQAELFELFQKQKLRRDMTIANIQRKLQTGRLTLSNAAYILQSSDVEGEGYENYVLAFLVLGSNISIGSSRSYNPSPSIILNDEQSPYFKGENQYFKFISCSPLFTYTSTTSSLAELVVATYDKLVWMFIGICYVIIPSILALIYLGYFKKLLKYPLRYSPFTSGAQALVHQYGDRMSNSKPVGFMTSAVISLHLMAIVLSYVIRGNIRFLNSASVHHLPFASSDSLHRYNITAYTDLHGFKFPVLKSISDFTDIYGSPERYDSIAKFLTSNPNVAYASWSNRVSDVVTVITQRWGDFVQYTMGYVSGYWWFPYPYQEGKRNTGWSISDWCDDRVPRRISALTESGIAQKWKQVCARDEAHYFRSKERSYGQPINMGNFCKIFEIGLYTICGCIGVWLLELLVYLVYTQICKKLKPTKKEKSKGKIVTTNEVVVVESKTEKIATTNEVLVVKSKTEKIVATNEVLVVKSKTENIVATNEVVIVKSKTEELEDI